MSYVDAHLHLADPAYEGRTDRVIQEALENGISKLLSNSMDYDTSVKTLSLARTHPGTVLAAIGVHPWTVVNSREPLNVAKFESLFQTHGQFVSAIGEIGADGQYTQEQTKKKQQADLFSSFLGLAERKGLPVVVHSRLAVDEVLASLSSFKLPKVLLHWYSGPIEKLASISDLGYLISIGPPVSYSKKLMEICSHADLRTILSETDGPVSYFGPFKNKLTTPSFIPEVVAKIAEIKHEKIDTVKTTIWENFSRFLGKPF